MTTGSGAFLNVRVIPRAAKSQITGRRDDALLVRLNAPPVDGAANTELMKLLAQVLGIPKRNIEIVAGHRSRTKRLKITGVTSAEVEKLCVPKRTS